MENGSMLGKALAQARSPRERGDSATLRTLLWGQGPSLPFSCCKPPVAHLTLISKRKRFSGTNKWFPNCGFEVVSDTTVRGLQVCLVLTACSDV